MIDILIIQELFFNLNFHENVLELFSRFFPLLTKAALVKVTD